jgi:hypothetical protein
MPNVDRASPVPTSRIRASTLARAMPTDAARAKTPSKTLTARFAAVNAELAKANTQVRRRCERICAPRRG